MALTTDQNQRVHQIIIGITSNCLPVAPKAKAMAFKLLVQEAGAMMSPAQVVTDAQYDDLVARAEAMAAAIGQTV